MVNIVSHDSETPAPGQQVITACAFIHASFDGEEKVFLPMRASTKKFLPGVFELPGGHIDYGEDIEYGLKREILEEFGKDIVLGEPFYVFTYTNDIKGSHSIEVIYFAQFKDGADGIQLKPEDHSQFVWVSGTEMSNVYTENKGPDDIEFRAVRRGFELLKGTPVKT